MGSVRPKQPTSSPLASPGRYFCFCASDPKAWIGCITRELCTDMAERYAESTLCYGGDGGVEGVLCEMSACVLHVGGDDLGRNQGTAQVQVEDASPYIPSSTTLTSTACAMSP